MVKTLALGTMQFLLRQNVANEGQSAMQIGDQLSLSLDPTDQRLRSLQSMKSQLLQIAESRSGREGDDLPPGVQELVAQIVALARTARMEMSQSHGLATKNIELLADNARSCLQIAASLWPSASEMTGSPPLDKESAEVAELVRAHNACRELEAGSDGGYHKQVSGVGGACDVFLKAVDKVADGKPKLGFASLGNFFQSFDEDTFRASATACDNAVVAYGSTVSQCKAKQTELEIAACNWHSLSVKIQNACSGIRHCRESHGPSLTQTCADLESSAEMWNAEELMLDSVECMAGKINSSSFAVEQLKQCDVPVEGTSKWNVTCPSVVFSSTHEEDCAAAVVPNDVSAVPGAEAWINTTYRQQSWWSIATNDAKSGGPLEAQVKCMLPGRSIVCSHPFVAANDGLSCVKCGPLQIATLDSKCETCGIGQVPSATKDACKACGATEIAAADGTCVPCSNGQQPNSLRSECEDPPKLFVEKGQIRAFWGNCIFPDETKSTKCCDKVSSWMTAPRDRCRSMAHHGDGNRIQFDSKNRELIMLNENQLYRISLRDGTAPSGTTIQEVELPTGWDLRDSIGVAYNSASGEYFTRDIYCRLEHLQDNERQELLGITDSQGEQFKWGQNHAAAAWMKLDPQNDTVQLAWGTCGYAAHCPASGVPNCESRDNSRQDCRQMWDYFDRLEELNNGQWIDPFGDVGAIASYSYFLDVDDDTGDLLVADHMNGNCRYHRHGTRSVVWMVKASTGKAKLVAGKLSGSDRADALQVDVPATQTTLGLRVPAVKFHPITKEPHFVAYPGTLLKVDSQGIIRKVNYAGCCHQLLSSFVFHKASNQWILSLREPGIIYQNGTLIVDSYRHRSPHNSVLGGDREYKKNDWRLQANHGPFNTADVGINTGWFQDMAIDNVNNELYSADKEAGLIWVIGL